MAGTATPVTAAPGRPRLRRALSLVVGAALVGLLAWGGYRVYRLLDVPVAVIGVEGEISHVTTAEVEQLVADNLGGGFVSLDLEAICAALESHPWIASAGARRKWPDQLVISLEEEVPIARWGRDNFLNNKGRILDVNAVDLPESLPLLDGPPGQERRVMRQYRTFSQVFQPAGLRIEEFRLAPRGNWQVTFASGPELVVGKEPVADKLDNFLLVWERVLASRADNVERVDIRYGNGVAVSWKETPEPPFRSDNAEQRSVNG